MGTVARQEKLGDSSITISFENYQDFLDYQKKEREQDALENQLEQLNSYIEYYSKLKEFDAASDIQKEIQAVEEKLKTLEESK